MLLVVLSASTHVGTEPWPMRDGSAQALPLFDFHSAFWLNLHHFLHAQARDDAPRADQLPDSAANHEREVWSAAVEGYRTRFGQRSLLFATPLVRLKHRLAAAESDESLRSTDIDTDVRALLESAAPIYRRYWWPAHDAENRRFIAVSTASIGQYGTAIAPRLAASFGTTWPSRPIRTDAVFDAGPPGNAYTTNDPTHITIGAGEAEHHGLLGLEVLFHEASHGWDATLMSDVGAAAERLGRQPPRQLWHALLFFNAGFITADVLTAGGIRDYQMYADRGLFDRAFEGLRAPIATHWPSYLAGTISRKEAVARIVRDVP